MESKKNEVFWREKSVQVLHGFSPSKAKLYFDFVLDPVLKAQDFFSFR